MMRNGGYNGNFVKSLSPKVYWGGGRPVLQLTLAKGGRKRHVRTSEVPHLCVFSRARLRKDLACRNALQAFGYVSVERTLAAMRGLLRCCLSEEWRRGREEATLCKGYVLRQPAP
jgi:hypothetical protein